ncbi:MAG: hypothetical protein NUK54_09480 [Methanothrix sp.]|nr:hypothetical protein [Methanothrix sp.]MCR3884590.1 hypothetical protein [Methanothrix sp.]
MIRQKNRGGSERDGNPRIFETRSRPLVLKAPIVAGSHHCGS